MLAKIRRYFAGHDSSPVVIHPREGGQRSVCISYIREPFLKNWTPSKARGHTNAFEVVAMAQAWLDEGFRVEVCGYDDRSYCPPADCAVVIDLHGNLERWSRLPGKRFLKVLHATGCHWKFQNNAERERLASLQKRRGVALEPRRQVAPSNAAEVADHIALTGNSFTMETFRHFGKPMERIPISSAYEFAWPRGRNYELARRKFLWIGSYGMVHKGLDLVLEAFVGMPDLELTVCGRPEKEVDFYQAYKRELTSFPNIRHVGWMDLSSAEFLEIARTHCAVIYPSCSEGGGGAVIHCMHAGMIPICTREASVDLGDFGLMLEDASIESVMQSVNALSCESPSSTESRAKHAYDHARTYHRRQIFASSYAQYVSRLARAIN